MSRLGILMVVLLASILWFTVGWLVGCDQTERELIPMINEQEEEIDELWKINHELTRDYLELKEEQE